jgi:amidase
MPIHHFQPTIYFHAIGSHHPVLTIADGDTVITTTLDAFGRDEHDAQAAPRGNPMTGPFYVEGAQPGDMVAFHIDRISPNRRIGRIFTSLAENTVLPEYVKQLPEAGEGEFRLDLEQNLATLISPVTALGNFTVPIQPMIGCFGVAPDRGQAISTATSGSHGGNMDYRGFCAGVTVYFPVYVAGALIHLGDIHAWQADGEILGTGIEVSAEVQFTVRLIKQKPANTVRGENADFIFTAGNARPLDQALQIATTEMAFWLQQDYGLDAHSAGLLLGHWVQYEVGNVYDPAYTMICKVPKAALKVLSG